MDASKASLEDAAAGRIKCSTSMLHQFLDAIDVDITLGFAGSDKEQLMVSWQVECFVKTRNKKVTLTQHVLEN
jgi:hypothetical protein